MDNENLYKPSVTTEITDESKYDSVKEEDGSIFNIITMCDTYDLGIMCIYTRFGEYYIVANRFKHKKGCRRIKQISRCINRVCKSDKDLLFYAFDRKWRI